MTPDQVLARKYVEQAAAFTACVAAGRAVQALIPGWGESALECMIRRAEDAALRSMQAASELDRELVESLAQKDGSEG